MVTVPDLNFPIVDLAPVIAGEAGAAERAAEQVRESFATTAFFFIAGHGVSPAMMDGIVEQSRRFHGQAMDDKMKVQVGPELLGYLPPGAQMQRSSIYNKNTRKELSASYYVRREYPDGHPDKDKPWSHVNKLPDDAALPGFRDALLGYYDALDGVFAHLLTLFSLALDLPPDYFGTHPGFSPPNGNLRLLEYFPQERGEQNLFGIGPHSDFGCITILNQGPSPGLEVLLPSGDWIDAPQLPGHFLINTGQFLTRWANDRIPATPHRVRNFTGKLRHSVAFLVGTRPDVAIDCLPSCTDAEHPAKYPPITYAEHIAAIRKQNYEIPADKENAA